MPRGRAWSGIDERRIAVRGRPGDATEAERRAFLDRACAGDVALRRRVELLLAAHDRSTGILDQPAGPPGSAEATARADTRRRLLAAANAPAPWSPAATG